MEQQPRWHATHTDGSHTSVPFLWTSKKSKAARSSSSSTYTPPNSFRGTTSPSSAALASFDMAPTACVSTWPCSWEPTHEHCSNMTARTVALLCIAAALVPPRPAAGVCACTSAPRSRTCTRCVPSLACLPRRISPALRLRGPPSARPRRYEGQRWPSYRRGLADGGPRRRSAGEMRRGRQARLGTQRVHVRDRGAEVHAHTPAAGRGGTRAAAMHSSATVRAVILLQCSWVGSHEQGQVETQAVGAMSKDAKAAEDGDVVPRNEFGGVYVDEEELRAAFDFFDVHKKGTLVCDPSVCVACQRGCCSTAPAASRNLPVPAGVRRLRARRACARPHRRCLGQPCLTLDALGGRPDTRRPETAPRRVLQKPAGSRVQVPDQRARLQLQHAEEAARQ